MKKKIKKNDDITQLIKSQFNKFCKNKSIKNS